MRASPGWFHLLILAVASSTFGNIPILVTVEKNDYWNFDGGFEWDGEWSVLIQYLLASAFVLFGLHHLLYTDYLMKCVLKEYRDLGLIVPADVLSCDSTTTSRIRKTNKYTVELLYLHRVSVHADRGYRSREEFRNPGQVVVKQFLRRVDDMESPLVIGKCNAQVLVLPGLPKSGMPPEIIERDLGRSSNVRACLIGAPGTILLGFAVWAAVREVQQMDGDNKWGWVVFVLLLTLACYISVAWCRHRINKKKQQLLYGAVSMVRTGNQLLQPPPPPPLPYQAPHPQVGEGGRRPILLEHHGGAPVVASAAIVPVIPQCPPQQSNQQWQDEHISAPTV